MCKFAWKVYYSGMWSVILPWALLRLVGYVVIEYDVLCVCVFFFVSNEHQSRVAASDVGRGDGQAGKDSRSRKRSIIFFPFLTLYYVKIGFQSWLIRWKKVKIADFRSDLENHLRQRPPTRSSSCVPYHQRPQHRLTNQTIHCTFHISSLDLWPNQYLCNLRDSWSKNIIWTTTTTTTTTTSEGML